MRLSEGMVGVAAERNQRILNPAHLCAPALGLVCTCFIQPRMRTPLNAIHHAAGKRS